MKKVLSIFLAVIVLFSMSVTAFAAELPGGIPEEGYSFYYRDCEDGIIETPFEGKITEDHHPAIDTAASARGVYTYTVTQTSRGLFDGYYPITNWALGPGVLTYTASVGTTVSFEVSGSISAEVEVPAAKLSAELGASVGGSTTFTAWTQKHQAVCFMIVIRIGILLMLNAAAIISVRKQYMLQLKTHLISSCGL